MEPIVKFEICEGILSWGGHSLKLTFDLIVLKNGEIIIDFGSQPLTNDNIWIEMAYSPKKPTVEVLALEGTTSEGYLIKSDSVFLKKCNLSSDQNGSAITVEATASQIDIRVLNEATKTIDEARVDFLVAGLRCFEQIKIENDLGEIYIAGSSKVEDFTKICGLVSLRKHISDNDSFDNWLESVKEQAERIQNLLSFATGRFLKTSILRVYRGGTLSNLTLYRRFSDARPYKPPFSYLHLRPIIELGVNRYTTELISKTGMDVALEWHLMPHTYNEDRYLGQMTALEHLVHVFREQRPSNRVLPKAKFRNIVRPALQKKLDELVPKLCDDPKEIEHVTNIMAELKAKIGNLNMQTLQSSLQSMLMEYRVPLDGLVEFIPDLIEARNKIVHKGLHERSTDQKSLSTYLSAAEELLTRVFLSLLDYEGDYQTYFGTVDFRPFKRLPVNVTG
jgi:hypothetical protein